MSDSSELVIKVTGGDEFSGILDRLTKGLNRLNTAMETGASQLTAYGRAWSSVDVSQMRSTASAMTRITKSINQLPNTKVITDHAKAITVLSKAYETLGKKTMPAKTITDTVSKLMKVFDNMDVAAPSQSVTSIVDLLRQLATVVRIFGKLVEKATYQDDVTKMLSAIKQMAGVIAQIDKAMPPDAAITANKVSVALKNFIRVAQDIDGVKFNLGAIVKLRAMMSQLIAAVRPLNNLSMDGASAEAAINFFTNVNQIVRAFSAASRQMTDIKGAPAGIFGTIINTLFPRGFMKLVKVMQEMTQVIANIPPIREGQLKELRYFMTAIPRMVKAIAEGATEAANVEQGSWIKNSIKSFFGFKSDFRKMLATFTDIFDVLNNLPVMRQGFLDEVKNFFKALPTILKAVAKGVREMDNVTVVPIPVLSWFTSFGRTVIALRQLFGALNKLPLLGSGQVSEIREFFMSLDQIMKALVDGMTRFGDIDSMRIAIPGLAWTTEFGRFIIGLRKIMGTFRGFEKFAPDTITNVTRFLQSFDKIAAAMKSAIRSFRGMDMNILLVDKISNLFKRTDVTGLQGLQKAFRYIASAMAEFNKIDNPFKITSAARMMNTMTEVIGRFASGNVQVDLAVKAAKGMPKFTSLMAKAMKPFDNLAKGTNIQGAAQMMSALSDMISFVAKLIGVLPGTSQSMSAAKFGEFFNEFMKDIVKAVMQIGDVEKDKIEKIAMLGQGLRDIFAILRHPGEMPDVDEKGMEGVAALVNAFSNMNVPEDIDSQMDRLQKALKRLEGLKIPKDLDKLAAIAPLLQQGNSALSQLSTTGTLSRILVGTINMALKGAVNTFLLFPRAVKFAVTSAITIVTALGKGIAKAFSGIFSVVRGLASRIGSLLTRPLEFLREKFRGLITVLGKVKAVFGMVIGVFGRLAGVVRSALGAVASSAGRIFSGVVSLGQNIVRGIVSGLAGLASKIGSALGAALSVAGRIGGMALKAGLALAGMIGKGIMTGLRGIKWTGDFLNSLVNAARSKIQQISDMFGGLSQRLMSISRTMVQAGQSLLQSPMSLGNVMQRMDLSSVMDFDAVIQQIKVLGGVSADAMPEVRDFLLQLGADSVFSASEAADAYLELAKSGLSVQDSMASLPAMMDLAAAGGISIADSASLVISTVGSFGKTFGDTTDIVDSFAAAANVSTAGVADLAAAFSYAAPQAAAAGAEIDQLNAMAALLADRGIEASRAGTSLRQLFSSLTAPTDAAREVLDGYGISLFDTAGNMRDMGDVMGDMAGVFNSLTQEQQLAFAESVGGSANAVSALQVLLDTAEDGGLVWEDYNEAMSGSASAAEIGAALMDTFKGSMEALRGSVETLMIKAFTPLMNKVLRPLVDLTTEIINVISGLNENVLAVGAAFALLIPALVSFAGVGMMVIGWVMAPMGMLFSALQAALITIINPLMLVSTVVGAGLGFTALLGVLAAVIPALLSIGAAFKVIQQALKSDLLVQQVQVFKDAITSLKAAFEGFGAALATVLSGLNYGIFGANGGTQLQTIFAVRHAVLAVADAVQSFADRLEYVKQGTQAFAQFFDLLRIHNGAIASSADDVHRRWAALTAFMQNNPLFERRLGEGFNQQDVVDYFYAFDQGMQKIQTSLAGVAGVVGSFISDLFNDDVGLADAFRSLFADGASAIAEVAGGVLSVIEHVFGVDISDSLVENLQAGNVREVLSAFGRQLIEWIVMGSINAIGTLATIGASLIDVLLGWDIADEVTSIFSRLSSIFQAGLTLITTLIQKFLPGMGDIGSTVENLLDIVDTALYRVEQFMFDLNAVLGGSMAVQDSIFGDLFSIDPETGEALFDFSDAVGTVIEKLSSFGTETLLPGLNDQFSSLGDTLSSIDWGMILTELGQSTLLLVDAIGSGMGDLLAGILNSVANINWDAVGTTLQNGAAALVDFMASTVSIGLGNMVTFVQDVDWQGVWDSLLAGFNAFLSGVITFVDLSLSKVISVVDDLADWFSVPENVAAFQTNVTAAVTGIWDAVGDIPIALLDHLIPGFDAEAAKESWSSIGDSVASTLNSVLGGAFSALFGEEGTGADTFHTKLNDAKTAITGFLSSLWTFIEPFAVSLGDSMSTVWGSIQEAFASLGELDLSPLVDFFTDEGTVAAIEAGLGAVAGFFYALQQVGLGIFNGFASAVPSMVAYINALLQGDWSGVADAIKGVFTSFIDGFMAVIEKVPGFSAALAAIKKVYFLVIAELVGALSSALGYLTQEVDFGLGNVNPFAGQADGWIEDLNAMKDEYLLAADTASAEMQQAWDDIWPDPEPAAAEFRSWIEEWDSITGVMESPMEDWTADLGRQLTGMFDEMSSADFTSNAAALDDFRAAITAMADIPMDELLATFSVEKLMQFEQLAQIDIPEIGLTPAEIGLEIGPDTAVTVPDGLADDLATTLADPLPVDADLVLTSDSVDMTTAVDAAADFEAAVTAVADDTTAMRTVVETDWPAVAESVTINVPVIVEQITFVTTAWTELTEAVTLNHTTTMELVPEIQSTVGNAMAAMVTATKNQSNALARLMVTTTQVQASMIKDVQLLQSIFVSAIRQMEQAVWALNYAISMAGAALLGSGLAQAGGGIAMPVAGARARGGPVRKGSLYEVAENGVSELLKLGGKTYLIPGQNGSVIPPSAVMNAGARAGARAGAAGIPSPWQLGIIPGQENGIIGMNDPQTANLEVNRHQETILAHIDKTLGEILAWVEEYPAYWDEKFKTLLTAFETMEQSISSAISAISTASSGGGGGVSGGVSGGSYVGGQASSAPTTSGSSTVFDIAASVGSAVSSAASTALRSIGDVIKNATSTSSGSTDIWANSGSTQSKLGMYSWENITGIDGGRYFGGQTARDSIYAITETGKPEIYSEGTNSYLLTGNQSGRVSPLDKFMQPKIHPMMPVAGGAQNGYNQSVTYDVNIQEGDINITAPGAGQDQVEAIRRAISEQQQSNRERISTVLKQTGRR